MAWKEFKKGKTSKIDIQEFELHLEDNIFEIHEQLKSSSYRPSRYAAFYVRDPKLRHIHKAPVRDRLVHHALFRILYPIFDKGFIYDSYSCRVDKGTHRGVARLENFLKKLSRGGQTIWTMKCDVKKFFDSVGHEILLGLIRQKITDPDVLWLTEAIINSFHIGCGKNMSSRFDLGGVAGSNLKGLPLGNVTSQLFANIYLNELDQFVKRKLKIKFYLRYCDDFIILNKDRDFLAECYQEVEYFLETKLKLTIHEHKTSIRKYRQGIDFLGYVLLPNHRRLRTKTKRRIFRKFEQERLSKNTIQSYLGVLSHANAYRLQQKLKDQL